MCRRVVVAVAFRPVMGWFTVDQIVNGCCCGGSETLLGRLIERLETLWVQSGGRVAGFEEVWQSLIW